MLLWLTPVDQFGQGEWRFLGREPQQGLACRHRRMASVDAHDTLVQIALELLRLNAVMRAVEPGLEGAQDSVDRRSNSMRSFGSADNPNAMGVATQGRIRIPTPALSSTR